MKRRRDHATFAEADIVLEQALEELDANVPNYNSWVLALVGPAAEGKIIELGAGRGTFSMALLQTASHVVAVEPSERASAALAHLAADNPSVTAVHGYASDAASFGPFDGGVMSNVLEHISDDEATLRELRTMIDPGGLVAVYSPAFQILMGRFDRSIGHVRRYRKRELCSTFRRAGYEVVDARYVNLPGFFGWLLMARILRLRPTHSSWSRWFDRWIVPPTRWVETRVRPPFGQSVLVIGRVPFSPSSSTD